ncbi:MAG: sensor domain-containing diguanylate cyclase [Deltaproteobacteria bacterium]|nr:sensor domain-containing diguanylate cyclase [Deltaproteobacteria bacterium]
MDKINITNEIINGFTNRLSHEEALSLAVQRIMDVVKGNSCAIITVDKKGCPTIKTARGLSNDYIKSFYAGCGKEIVNDIVKTGKGVLITKKHPMFNKEGYRFENDYKALFAVPLSIHSKTIGIMYADSSDAKVFSSKNQKIFTDISNLCSIIIDHEENASGLQEAFRLDSMTGLYSHRYFHEELHREIKRAAKTKHPVAILIASIGHINEYNSIYGHIAGDEAIKAIAEMLKENIRDIDLATRYGNRFAVIFPETDSNTARKIAESICGKLSSSSISKEKKPVLTLRIGIASFPKDVDNETDLINLAEKNVFESKRKGGNSITVS